MFPGYSHDIQIEHDAHAADLHRLAELDSAKPIAVPALVSRVNGEAVAALSLADDRAVVEAAGADRSCGGVRCRVR